MIIYFGPPEFDPGHLQLLLTCLDGPPTFKNKQKLSLFQ